MLIPSTSAMTNDVPTAWLVRPIAKGTPTTELLSKTHSIALKLPQQFGGEFTVNLEIPYLVAKSSQKKGIFVELTRKQSKA